MPVTPYKKAAEPWHPHQIIQENQTNEYQQYLVSSNIYSSILHGFARTDSPGRHLTSTPWPQHGRSIRRRCYVKKLYWRTRRDRRKTIYIYTKLHNLEPLSKEELLEVS